jgi:biopolymer transport protein ExbD
MHASDTADEAITGINVTPLVDITLVLLVVFMVTAKLIVSQSVPMDLPKASTAGTTQTILVVAVDDAGKVSIDGRPIADDVALFGAAGDALAREKELRVIVQAPASARHGAVVRVIDVLRSAGVARIAFAAEKIP